MPELPEIQALAERLDAMVSGRVLARVEPLQFSALKTVQPGPESVAGLRCTGVSRRGKYLVTELDGGRILVHFSQGGRLDVEDPPKRTRPKGGVVRFGFNGGPALLVKEFGTERKAGWWILPVGEAGPLASLGPEPDDEAFERFVREGDDRRRLHTILRDQRTVAGIGRGYADDILHRAQLSPFASLGSLDDDARERLLEAIRTVLEEALEAERKRRGGLPAKLGERFEIHHRWGQRCPRCEDDLRRVSFESHEITYCPACQTAGKVLADRRMSRLLK